MSARRGLTRACTFREPPSPYTPAGDAASRANHGRSPLSISFLLTMGLSETASFFILLALEPEFFRVLRPFSARYSVQPVGSRPVMADDFFACGSFFGPREIVRLFPEKPTELRYSLDLSPQVCMSLFLQVRRVYGDNPLSHIKILNFRLWRATASSIRTLFPLMPL